MEFIIILSKRRFFISIFMLKNYNFKRLNVSQIQVNHGEINNSNAKGMYQL